MVANSAADVAKRMQGVADATLKAQGIAMRNAATVAKGVQLAGLMGDAPGGRLRNVGKKGTRLGVRYTMRGTGAEVSAIVEATGAWPILNNPTKPHQIQGRKGKTLLFGGVFRRSVAHPGTRGKRTWQKAEPTAMAEASKALSKTLSIAIRGAFKG